MFRFLTTGVLTVVALLAAAAWWSGREATDARPAPSTELRRTAPVAEIETPPAPARPEPPAAKPEPVATRPARALPPIPAVPAPPAPPALTAFPEPAPVPAIPAPRIAAPEPGAERTFEELFPFESDAPETEVGETLVRQPAEFGEGSDDALLPEPPPEERTVAMRADHDASARLIRRLLDVYESLGRRP